MAEIEEPKTKREFGLTNLSLKNRTSVFLLAIIVAFIGGSTYVSVPKESFPEIVLPTIYVGTVYPGNSPIDMENLVTRPIEKELKNISGVKKITSTSIQDFSTIIVEFNPDVEVPEALTDVKDAVDQSKKDLPSDLDQDPNIFEMNFSDFPFMFVNMAGDYKQEQLKVYAEYLQDEFEKLKEVSEANIRGLNEKEVAIRADIQAMSANEVSFGDIMNAVGGENVSMSAGDILNNSFRRSVRILGEFDNAAEMENIVVKKENGKATYLRDLAEVEFTYKEPESFARMNGLPVLTLELKKKSGENLLDAADKIKEILDKAKDGPIPDDVELSITNDQSKFTRSMVNNLQNSIFAGVILVVLVLLFFMGVRNALFVGLAIPLSMCISFMILGAMGFTLNMMVLFSLILALGLLVDNGIVVVENIFRLMQEGKSALQAAKEGVGEVALPIISSTATTLAAFFPLVFWDSMIGEFMKFLPITLIVVLASSLFVALVFNPVFTSILMRIDDGSEDTGNKKDLIISLVVLGLGILFRLGDVKFLGGLAITLGGLGVLNIYALKPSSRWFQNVVLPWLENVYEGILSFALRGRMPYAFFGGTIALLILTFMLLGIAAPKVLFFPEQDPQYINVYAQFPVGTDIKYTDSVARAMEDRVLETIEPYSHITEATVTNVGVGTSDPNEGPQQGSTPHKARINVSFLEYQFREGISTSQIMDEIRQNLTDFPGVQISVAQNAVGPPVGPPINIEVTGEDIEGLLNVTNDLLSHVKRSGVDGIEELKIDIEAQKPQMLVNIDREKARLYGLSTSSISNALRTALFGSEISKFKVGEDDYEINLRVQDKYRYNIANLINQDITFRDASNGRLYQIPISSVADVQYGSTYGSIRRKDLDRVISIFSNVEEGYNANEIVNELKDYLSDYEMPEGYSFKFTGEQEEQAESAEFLSNAMLIAVFLIFLIMVSQFNSLTKPFIILASIIFSTIGVFLGIIFTGSDFVVIMTGIGVISLAGIVVNNAIVLIDYTDLIRERRRKELGLGPDERLSPSEFVKVLVQAGKTRLRPVLLTAITTVLGLVPLASGLNIDFYGLLTVLDPDLYMGGDNADFWGPMAWAVIYGLSFSTFLTLVVVPVMYTITDRMGYRLVNRKS